MKVGERGIATLTVWCAAILAAVAAAITGVAYVFSSSLPFEFSSELASAITGTSAIAAFVKSLTDLVDAIGWAGWANRTAFAFSPMTIYLATVPLAKMFGGNAYEAVKAIQVAEVLLAWSMAAYLYWRLRGRTAWAFVAGGLYALLPEQLLWVRASVEVGMIGALIPFALAVSIGLLRRWGAWALPLCGAIAGLVSAQFDLASAIFAGLPVFAFATAAGFDRRRPWLWAAASVAGIVCGIGTVAYAILPTFASRGIFSPPFSVHALLQSDVAHAPFILGGLAIAIVPLEAVVWSLAAGWAVWGSRARVLAESEGALLVAGAVCTVLSFALSDRFLMVAGAVAAVAAASALERLCASPRWRVYAAALGVLTIAASLVSFFLLRVFLGDPLPVEARAPQVPAGRAATLAWETSSPDWQLSVLSMPFVASQTDVTQRYAGDGLGGTGLLRRSDVTTIVASNGTTLPLEPARGSVRSVTPVCLVGGPGLLDRVAAMPVFEDAGFFDDSFPCKHALFADAAPVERSLGASTIEAFEGKTLFPQARQLVGADDRMTPHRFFVKDEWYRNAIDGDSPLESKTAIVVQPGDTASTLFETDAGVYSLAIHIVCHASVSGHVLRDATFKIPFACSPRRGFVWLTIPFGKIGAGEHSYSLTVDSAGAPVIGNGGWRAALDGVVLLSSGAPVKDKYDVAFAFSANRLDRPQWIAAGSYRAYFARRDGVQAGSVETFPRSGFHVLAWRGTSAREGDLLALVPVPWNTSAPPLTIAQRSNARWSIGVARKSMIEVAVFPDGDWRLEGKNVSLGGARCDLMNTCFGYVEPGRYELVHRWPGYVVFGFVLTFGAWFAAGLILLYAWRRETTTFDLQQTVDVSCPLTYFAYLGWLAAAVCTITYVNWVRLGDLGWMMAWQLFAIALLTLAALAISMWQRSSLRVAPGQPRHGLWLLWLAIAGLAVCAITSFALDAADQRLFVLAIAAIQACAVAALHPGSPRRMALWLGLGAAVAWSLTSGLMFTHLSDWLLGGDPTTGLAAVAFVASFGFVLYALRDSQGARASARSTVVAGAIAALVFIAFALRTDGLGAEWIPVHRSFFADVSQFVRDGHWMLWDVPSLYGFFSMLGLALVPAKDGWQALFELTAVFLVVQAGVVFTILRWGRRGWADALFAILFPLATIFGDGIARFPVSARLYPQGGMRFFWIVALLFVFFLSYVWREHPRRTVALRWAGHALWIASLLWSLEAGGWATAIWLPYLLLDALTTGAPGFRAMAGRFVRNLWPIAVLPALAVFAVDLFYKSKLGHAPDWRAYVEFTGLFTSGKVRAIFHVQYLGAGWTLLVVLAAVGALGVAAVRERRWDLFRLLAGAWLAVWATASYYALEPLDMYVALLLGVMVPAAAIAIFASREGLRDRATSLLARYSLAPLAIIAIALAFGEPARLAAMRLPFTPGWTLDVSQDAPPVSGELAAVMERAGIRPGDAVLVPNGAYWTEPQQGLIQPYDRAPGGGNVEFRAWLPASPVGPSTLYTALVPDRQTDYRERFLAASHEGGWYVTYRSMAACESLSSHLHTLSSIASTNFAVSRCAYRP